MKKEESKNHTIIFELTQDEIKECIEIGIKQLYSSPFNLSRFEYSCRFQPKSNGELVAIASFWKELE